MAKQLKFGDDARQALARGVNTLAKSSRYNSWSSWPKCSYRQNGALKA